ncbi:hypothetical protein [Streptomyces sp. x-80]|uniref:hypothetical protein n=1 Tax=Streptomyces sp. x-80 TaxID=2789282 RepID=UPI00397EE95A
MTTGARRRMGVGERRNLAAPAAVSAAYDPGMAKVVDRMLADEPADGIFGELVGRPGALRTPGTQSA